MTARRILKMRKNNEKLCWRHFKERGEEYAKLSISEQVHAKIMNGIRLTSSKYCDACSSNDSQISKKRKG